MGKRFVFPASHFWSCKKMSDWQEQQHPLLHCWVTTQYCFFTACGATLATNRVVLISFSSLSWFTIDSYFSPAFGFIKEWFFLRPHSDSFWRLVNNPVLVIVYFCFIRSAITSSLSSLIASSRKTKACLCVCRAYFSQFYGYSRAKCWENACQSTSYTLSLSIEKSSEEQFTIHPFVCIFITQLRQLVQCQKHRRLCSQRTAYDIPETVQFIPLLNLCIISIVVKRKKCFFSRSIAARNARKKRLLTEK